MLIINNVKRFQKVNKVNLIRDNSASGVVL